MTIEDILLELITKLTKELAARQRASYALLDYLSEAVELTGEQWHKIGQIVARETR